MRSTTVVFALILAASCAKNEGTPLGGPADSGVDPNQPNMTDDGGMSMPKPAYSRLFIMPADPTLVVENGAGTSVDFELWGTDQSGTDQKITGSVLWRTNDDRLGAFADEAIAHYSTLGERA